MANTKLTSSEKRIMKDLKPFITGVNKPDDIFINVNKKMTDIKNIKCMTFCPKDSAYKNCVFFYNFSFDNNYPLTSPKGVFVNIDSRTRLHPNLYENGKICLSSLGGWHGEPWRPTETITSALLSLMVILDENPITKEPSYEDYTLNNKVAFEYLKYVKYNSLRLGIIEVINNKFSSFECFRDQYLEHFKNNHESILDDFDNCIKEFGESFISDVGIYAIKKTKLSFKQLKNEYIDAYRKIIDK